MPLLYYVQNTAIGIILTLIILYYVLGQGGKRQPLDSIFIYLLFSVLILLVLELFMDIFNGGQYRGARLGNIISSFLFYICLPWPGYCYYLYIDQLQEKWVRMPLKLGLIVAIPMLLSSLLVVVSLCNGMVFSIDVANLYQRGEALPLVLLCNAFYLVAGQIHAVMLYQKKKQNAIPFLIFFPYPVIIAAFIQLFTEHISLLLVTFSLTLLMVYLRIQNSQANKDFLTSLYNRSIGESYLGFLFQKKGAKPICGILMDIDGFKQINDTFGHDAGDTALRYISKLLSDSFSRSWLICRYGGDEFLLVRELDTDSELEKEIQRCLSNIEFFNLQGKLPFSLQMSMGTAVVDERAHSNLETFLQLLDKRMYQNKKEHRLVEKRLSTGQPSV